MGYSLDTKVGDILKDTHAVEILERHVPGHLQEPHARTGKRDDAKVHPRHAATQAKRAGLTEDMVSKVLTEINARK